MPPAKFNRSVVLFDLKMKREKSISILEQLIVHKCTEFPKDTLQLVLLHSEETNNTNNYPHIVTATSDILYKLEIRSTIAASEICEADWLNGLELAAEILSETTEQKNIMTHQLIFITDFDSQIEVKDRREDINRVITSIYDNSIYLYIIGPEIIPGITIKYKEDISEAMQKLKFVDETMRENECCKVGLEIVQETSGVLCGPDMALDLLTLNSVKIPKQPWNEPLTFMDFEFPTSCSKILCPDNKLKFGIEKQDIKHYIGDSMEEISSDDSVPMYHYMEKSIPIPKDVENSFKFEGNRMFKLIGFVNSEDISELFMGYENIYQVTLIDETDTKAEAFYSLVAECHKLKKYGLALKSHNKNNAPILFILIPNPPHKFLMVPHPEKVTYPGEIVKKVSSTSPKDTELFKEIDNYLEELSHTNLNLHPLATIGPQKKSYYKNIVNVVDKKEKKVESKVKVVDSEALRKCIEKESKKQVENFIDEDDDDEDW